MLAVRIRSRMISVSNEILIHRLTLPKGVYSFRYFLSPMRIPNLVMHIFILPNPFVVCSWIYASLLQLDLNAYTYRVSNCNSQAKCIYIYMHEQITKGFGIMNTCIRRFGIRIGDRKYLNEYTPFISVSLWSGHEVWTKNYFLPECIFETPVGLHGSGLSVPETWTLGLTRVL